MMKLETVFNEKINFYQPILSIGEVESSGIDIQYGLYKEALSIRFIGYEGNLYFIDNQENRKVLSDNGYSLT